MSSKKTWKTVAEATTKCRMETTLLLKWAERGVIRAQNTGTRSMRIRTDDLEIQLLAITGIRVAL